MTNKTSIPARPKLNDPDVLALFYKLFSVEMQKYCQGLCQGMPLADIEAGLSRSGMPESDGYEYAKELERYGLDGITADDVETLDCAYSVLRDAHKQIITKWISDNNIKPALSDGAPCSYKGEIGTAHYGDYAMKVGEYLFRSEKWIAERGNQGGQHVAWEEVIGHE